jgi:hypothetical protein
MTSKSIGNFYKKSKIFLRSYYEYYRTPPRNIYYHEKQLIVTVGYDYISWKGKYTEGKYNNKGIKLIFLDDKIKYIKNIDHGIELADQTTLKISNLLSFLTNIMLSSWANSGWARFGTYGDLENRTNIQTETGLLVMESENMKFTQVWLPNKKLVFNSNKRKKPLY